MKFESIKIEFTAPLISSYIIMKLSLRIIVIIWKIIERERERGIYRKWQKHENNNKLIDVAIFIDVTTIWYGMKWGAHTFTIWLKCRFITVVIIFTTILHTHIEGTFADTFQQQQQKWRGCYSNEVKITVCYEYVCGLWWKFFKIYLYVYML